MTASGIEPSRPFREEDSNLLIPAHSTHDACGVIVLHSGQSSVAAPSGSAAPLSHACRPTVLPCSFRVCEPDCHPPPRSLVPYRCRIVSRFINGRVFLCLRHRTLAGTLRASLLVPRRYGGMAVGLGRVPRRAARLRLIAWPHERSSVAPSPDGARQPAFLPDPPSGRRLEW